MARESDILFALLALRAGVAPRDRILECAMVLAETPDARLEQLLAEQGLLSEERLGALQAEVRAEIGRHGGDAAKAVTSASQDPELRRVLEAGFLSEHRVTALPLVPDPAVIVARPSGARYELGRELGHGGIGRVVSAQDRDLARDVALKIVPVDDAPDTAARFVREARLSARLQHPNIVPVHDFGSLTGPGGEQQLFICMKRIEGRDLMSLLREIVEGDGSLAAVFTRARLLRIFQDVCLAVAYAHSKGVIHRDLKPSNVMLGEYGEVLVVDWGLAKERGQDAPPARAPLPESTTVHTPVGDVMGTPWYMPPEQALGHYDEIDERSDIFSLGAILYEILTFQPPFPGASAEEALRRAQAGRILIPSHLLAMEAWPPVAMAQGISPELDSICMKALAPKREERYARAMELHDEIQLFLEGVKERERNHHQAEEAVAKARSAAARQKQLQQAASQAEAEAKRQEKEAEPLEAKPSLWAAQDRVDALRRAAVEAFSEANAAIGLALGFERGNVEARQLWAELAWAKFLKAEEDGKEEEMLLNRRLVERYNDGPFDALLAGEGALTVRTRAYECRCLLAGRDARPEELGRLGYHLFSGRSLEGHPGAEGVPDLEPATPVRLKAHGSGCAAAPVLGAHVWLWRYEEIGRLLMPATPEGATRGPVAPPLDTLFPADSPFRPQGPGEYLGLTPLRARALPMGSYLLVLHRDGFEPIRCPVTIPRCGTWEQDVTLFRPGEIPAGFLPIPSSSVCYQGDSGNPHSEPGKTVDLDDYFMARHPVTCREYCEFLNDLAKTRPDEAARRAPREADSSGFYWPGPPWAVPTAAWLAGAPAELKAKAKRLSSSPVDWEEDWPVFSVSWEDGMAYAAWKRAGDGSPATLPHEMEWEKAARGTDRRPYPFGRHLDERWCNNIRSHPGESRPSVVTGFPFDESPYGVRGFAGNSRDACLNSAAPDHPGWRIFRGGYWPMTGIVSRASHRGGLTTRSVLFIYGFRLAQPARLAGPG
ncbi:MAG: serine/threonine protein kinase [Planctomycetota bacterium]|nr:MAG: serine/threonine protein kinase [Planctomycetota bacterium]